MIRFKQTEDFVKGPLQMVGSSLFFAVMAYFVKLSTMSGVPAAEVALIRFSFGMIVAIFLGLIGRVDLTASRKGLLAARGIFGGGAIVLYFLAMEKGTLTNATVLNNTYPIFAAIASVFLLKEMMRWPVACSLAAAWIGVGMLTHPDPRHMMSSDLLALASGVLGGLAVTVVRKLRREGESAWAIFFYLSIFGWLASLILTLNHWINPGFIEWVYILLAAFLGMIAQVMMTSAFKYCQTAVGGVLSMTTMVFSTGFGWVFLRERLSGLEVVGVALIIIGSVWVVFWTQRVPVKSD